MIRNHLIANMYGKVKRHYSKRTCGYFEYDRERSDDNKK